MIVVNLVEDIFKRLDKLLDANKIRFSSDYRKINIEEEFLIRLENLTRTINKISNN